MHSARRERSSQGRDWLAVAGIATGALLLMASPAVAEHFNGSDAVDGGTIHYVDYTKYDDSIRHSRNAWHAVGSIRIEPDSWSTVNDLTISDVDRSDVTWAGLYIPNSGANEMWLNEHYLGNEDFSEPNSGYDRAEEHALVAHEFGHALGLGDHEMSKWDNSSLMYACPRCFQNNTGESTPRPHDEYDYGQLW